VLILLLVGFLRARGGKPNLSAEAAAPSGTGSSAAAPGAPAAPDSPGPTTTAGPMTPVPSATTAAPPVPAGTRPTTSAGRGPRIVAWIRDLGLTGGGGSYQEAFIAELSWGRCAELQRDVDSAPKDEVDNPTLTLYRAAAQACLAAFHGKQSLWPAADAAVEELSGRSAALDCIDRSAYDLTRTLVKIHRSAPDAVLQRGHADDADGPCPRVRSIEPGGGPAAGGYEVRITGEKLPNPAVIHFGEVTRAVPTSGGRTAVVTVPPVGEDYDVAVWVDGWPFGDQHSPMFSYERPASSASSAADKSHGP
jgi:hypothetical protein